jgi:hypothetical protein
MVLMGGSICPGVLVVVGCGCGVTVTTVGGKVVPPMIVVEPPKVHVSMGGVYVTVPQMMTSVELVSVLVAPETEVVPLITLFQVGMNS